MPAYNAEKTLNQSLDSLLNQTFRMFETIIIDDGSTDSTALVAQQYTDKDQRFNYYHQENSGVSAARNKGVELSNGKFICFLDSDDYFEDTYLEKMYSKIIEADYDVCYCGYNIVSNNSIKMKKTSFRKGDILLEKMLGKINVATMGWLIKKKILKENNISFSKGISWGKILNSLLR